MRRFEQGGRFWEIEVSGKRFTTRVGRVGKRAEGASRDFDSEQDAREAAEAMIRRKVDGGFRLATCPVGR